MTPAEIDAIEPYLGLTRQELVPKLLADIAIGVAPSKRAIEYLYDRACARELRDLKSLQEKESV